MIRRNFPPDLLVSTKNTADLQVIQLTELMGVIREVNFHKIYMESIMVSQSDSTFQLHEIGQIAVPVSDIDRAIAFYRDMLGMTFLFKAPPGLAFFDCNGIRLLLDAAAETRADVNPSIIYYKVPDIQAAFQALSSRGVPFNELPHLVAKMPDHDLWMAFFNDPDKNTLALMCEIR